MPLDVTNPSFWTSVLDNDGVNRWDGTKYLCPTLSPFGVKFVRTPNLLNPAGGWATGLREPQLKLTLKINRSAALSQIGCYIHDTITIIGNVDQSPPPINTIFEVVGNLWTAPDSAEDIHLIDFYANNWDTGGNLSDTLEILKVEIGVFSFGPFWTDFRDTREGLVLSS